MISVRLGMYQMASEVEVGIVGVERELPHF